LPHPTDLLNPHRAAFAPRIRAEADREIDDRLRQALDIG
jgi:hypothetical protein